MKLSRRKFLTAMTAAAGGIAVLSVHERAEAFFNVAAFWKKKAVPISLLTYSTTTTVNNQVWVPLTEVAGTVYAGVGGAGNNDGVRLRVFTADANYTLTAGANSLIGGYEFNAAGMTELTTGKAVWVGEPYASWTATIHGFNFNSSGITSLSSAQTNGYTCYPARPHRCGSDWAVVQTYSTSNWQYATIWDGTTLTLSNSLSVLGYWPGAYAFYALDSSNVLYISWQSGGTTVHGHLITRSGSTLSAPQTNQSLFTVSSPTLHWIAITLSNSAVWVHHRDLNQSKLITRSGSTLAIGSAVSQTLTNLNAAVTTTSLRNPRMSFRESWKNIGTDQWLVPIQRLVSGTNYQVDIVKLSINASTGAATETLVKSAIYTYVDAGDRGVNMIPADDGKDLIIMNYKYAGTSNQPVDIVRVRNAFA